ncbi:hypothetical protein ACHQM5_027618 [Ranunculus cassubicifolius]
MERWENLHSDILVQVFAKVDTKTLITSVLFVCKSWFTASSNPGCWKNLDFQSLSTCIQKSDVTKLMQSTICRSNGNVSSIVLPKRFDCEAVSDLLAGFLALKSLAFRVVPYGFMEEMGSRSILRNMMNLEELELGYCNPENLRKMLMEIGFHCKKFVSLTISPDTDRYISMSDALAIVELVPEIKYLNLRRCRLPRENLVVIIKGCDYLVRLDVRDCVGFEAADNEILKMASFIKGFMPQGSTINKSKRIMEYKHCYTYTHYCL